MLDLKGKKIGFILNKSNNIIFDRTTQKIKELEKCGAEIITINQSSIKQEILSIFKGIEFLDIVVIIPCSR